MAQTATFDRDAWSALADTLRSTASGERVFLSSAFIVPESERVTVGNHALARADYEINYQQGMVRINVDIPEGALVVVSYRRKPFLLESVYALREIELSQLRADVPAPRPSRKAEEREEPMGNLIFGGSKSVSFAIGSNKGTTLDQTLQATVEGQLTPTIRVKALLSDNNLPIQPEGNTEELEYLDKVFVEIEGSHARATLGDFAFSNSVSTFSPFTRQLKGISTHVHAKESGVRLVGATSKGTFETVKFRGVTGLQGPYELLSAGRNTGVVIIAGTEQVYLDGQLLRRGQNREYTIDYDRGTITFTPVRLITKDSEIAVDFEASQEQYERTALFSGVETARLPFGTRLDVVVGREKDDRDSPLNDAFSEEELEALRMAGDDPAQALTSGVAQTDPGRGRYLLIPADTVAGTLERFEFSDSIGDYNVTFVEVGVGRGDYLLGGIGTGGRPYYKFVGPDQGNYTVGKAPPLPQSLGLLTARLRREPGSRVSFDLEWNVSDFDRNLFSGLDDGDNVGAAGRASIGLHDIGLPGGALGVTGSMTVLEDRFKSFDKARPSYFYRDWNLENEVLIGRETIQELTTSFARSRKPKPDAQPDVAYTLGRIERDDFTGVKHEGNFSLGALGDRGVRGRAFDSTAEKIGEDRSRRHLTLDAAYGMGKVAPLATYAVERYRQTVTAAADTGIAYSLVRLRLGNRKPKLVNMSVEAENRDTEDIDPATDSWRDARRDQTFVAALSMRSSGPVQGEFKLTRRIEKNRVLDDRATTDLARLKGILRLPSAGLRSDIDYEISQNQTRIQQRSVVFLGEGKGDYNAQGELVGKGRGDYTVVFLPTTTTTPTRSVNLIFRLVWRKAPTTSPAAAMAAAATTGTGLIPWIKRNVSLDQTISVTEQSQFDPAWKVYLLLQSALQRNETTLFGQTSIRQDWSFLDGYRGTSLTLRYQRDDQDENRFEGVNEDRFLGEHKLRLSRSVSQRLTSTAEAAREVRRRQGEGIDVGTGSQYDVVTWSGLGGIGLRFSAGSSMDVDVKVSRLSDDLSGTVQSVFALRPRFVWRVSRAVSVFGSYEMTQTWESDETVVKPVFFSGEGDAHRWTVTPNIRVSKTISIIASYQGRSETTFSGVRISENELRLETRAFF